MANLCPKCDTPLITTICGDGYREECPNWDCGFTAPVSSSSINAGRFEELRMLRQVQQERDPALLSDFCQSLLIDAARGSR